MAALAQESQSSSTTTGNSAAGYGNGGAALGAGGQAAGSPSSSSSAQSTGDGSSGIGSPDAAAKVGTKPADAKAADDTSTTNGTKAADTKTTKATGKAAKTSDTEAAPEEPAAQAMAAASATPTSGDPEAIGTPKVDLPKSSGNGNLGYSIAIDVPAFHGIEPQIALNYNSSRKTKLGGLYQGWLGYAWGLDGFDVIERATPGYGMPAYDANDIYLLDGQAMVACTAGMVSPSCATGGTHATENESYRRIAFNSSANQWTVTDRDGTVSTFRSVGAVANLTPTAGTPAYDLAMSYRWLLTSVTDTNGNTVSYSYTCPASPVCYPASVSYNGTSITFYYETRPDMILMGNGRDISETSQRIKTIGITVSGAVRGAYKLTYDQAPFSNTSRLTQVTRYGTDATGTADGTITGGTSKIIGQMTYQNTDGVYGTVASKIYGQPLVWGQTAGKKPREVGDLDFDGREEVFGSYTESADQSTGGGGTTTVTKAYERVIKFDANGARADTKTVEIGGWAFSGPGHFLGTKNAMDFFLYDNKVTSARCRRLSFKDRQPDNAGERFCNRPS
ncbi:SpvB/TcaC N-terminal domain-containing protein [Mesorhizobium huakuii]|uniref:SpvB/TcaC N-terminal domain-containing protein n=1 Tax=Mesorhizobium huakuii TaxID=28104 RepID=A0ABZ0VIV2_9HYPH|nr:SpvB/TcaC N-terminal domain-containing protein [Mesorhizobium huakuii]WQB97384.1 SpvB/TcaC N-terminal domain-containing protein [Mesorhizobium huakuii]